MSNETLCDDCVKHKETGKTVNYGQSLGLKYYTGGQAGMDYRSAHGIGTCSKCRNAILRDCAGTQVTITSSEHQERERRLNNNRKTLHHQTKEEYAKLILSSQKFKRGSSGYAGGGIYFACSAEETRRKAKSRGVLLKATVRLGNVLTIRGSDSSWYFSKLLKSGYDSIRIEGLSSGIEYVVYNWDQVVDIQRTNMY